jgi:hypothetical protein
MCDKLGGVREMRIGVGRAVGYQFVVDVMQ